MRNFLIFISLLLAFNGVGQSTSFDLLQWSKREAIKDAFVGVSVVRLDDKQPLISYNQNLGFAPASLTKIVTTATALEMLGSDYVIRTEIGYSGRIDSSVLIGDLQFLGHGDPTIGSKYFIGIDELLGNWIDSISGCGIKQINGNIVMASQNFSRESVSSRWIWEDMGNYYGSGVYPFSVSDNTYKLAFKTGAAGSKAAIVWQSEEATGIDFKCHVLAANNKKDSAYIYGDPQVAMRTVCGSVPANKDRFTIKGSVQNPPLVLGRIIRNKLKERGIDVTGEVVVCDSIISNSSSIAIFNSPRLRFLIKETNYHSVNLFADHLFWQLALSRDLVASHQNASRVLTQFWADKGLYMGALKLWDGSGLAPQNTLSPEFLTSMLTWMCDSSLNTQTFISSLPKAGEDGTVRYLLSGTRLQGKVSLKSGSMYGVRCYAGYVNENGLPKYAFAIMINHFSTSPESVIKAIEELMLGIF